MSQKDVHFDSQLEYVKLFVADQKPLAISRDGSPSESNNTSGTGSNFPMSIFVGGRLEEFSEKYNMQLCIINSNSDEALQSLSLTLAPDGVESASETLPFPNALLFVSPLIPGK